jgi:hypothetical protein
VSPRLKKFLGLFVLLPALGGYFAAVIVVADKLPDFWLAKLVYFLVAGIAWAFPAQRMMRWMNAEPKRLGK